MKEIEVYSALSNPFLYNQYFQNKWVQPLL